MNYEITRETIDQLASYRRNTALKLKWEPLFLLPEWLKVWLACFAPNVNPTILTVRNEREIIGVAPLVSQDGIFSIIGSPNVCDYFDFPIVPGKEDDFYSALLDHLKTQGVKTLDTGVIRPDSTIFRNLVGIAKRNGFGVTLAPDEVTLEKELPLTFVEYLQSLDSKQRHEVRRKLRRFEAAGSINFKPVRQPDEVPVFVDIFLKMFVESREDKADFLTPPMEKYFRMIISKMSEFGWLRGCILELDTKPVATLVSFDYNNVIYLYNSGFDRNYDYLSVGIISKILLIKDSIESGKKRFDFLKGGEHYKYQLGGKEIKLQKCLIKIG